MVHLVIHLVVLYGLSVPYGSLFDCLIVLPPTNCINLDCQPVVNQSITEKQFVGKRISLYANSSVTFRYRLLLAGDINPNPGPPNYESSDLLTSNDTVPTTKLHTLPITYSREALLNLNGPYRMPPEVWQNLKDLKLNATVLPVGRGGVIIGM